MSEKESLKDVAGTLLSVKDVAEIFSVSIYAVYAWVRKGTVESVHVKGPSGKGTVRIRTSSIRKLLETDDQVSA